MKSFSILVTIFQFLGSGVQKFHIIGGAKLGGGGRSIVQAAQGGLDKSCLSTLCAVLHFQYDMGGALVKDCPAFANFCG